MQQDASIPVPAELPDAVQPSAAEQKQRIGERVRFKPLLHHGRHPIDSFPQIRIAAGEIYTLSALVKLRSMISVPGKSSTLQPCPHLNRCLLSLFRSGCLQPLHPLSPAQAAMGVLLRLIRPYL